MCNIAGYIGDKQAAPILIEMMRAQEGLDAGFYTGIATIHEGKIHYRKLVGNLDRLLEETDAANLPGTIGIIHSRTPGDTGDSWAHPFVCEREGEIKTAYVLNGCGGCFKKVGTKGPALAEELLAKGFEFKSRLESNGKEVTLSDNTRVHPSDILCQLIASKMEDGLDVPDAMAESYNEFPKEVVGLMLTLAEPNAIAWARMNFPMFIGYAEHGAYLATAPQAFPKDASEPHLLPVLSSGLIYKDSFTCKPFKKKPAVVAEFDAHTRKITYDAICNALREDKQTVPKLGKLIWDMFEPADCTQRGAAIYSALYDLDRQGKLKMETKYKPGVFEGLEAPVYHMWIED